MSKTLTKKQQTRKRMLDAAGKSFRSNGYAGIGVDGIARTAGATSGAFYAHFGSKNGAFRAALTVGLDEVIAGIPTFQHEHGDRWTSAFAEYYLGRPHRDDLACGCAMTTLTPEVVRSDDELHEIFEAKMTEIVKRATDGLSGGSQQDLEARAWAMFATLVGGLNIVRAMIGTEVTEKVAGAIKAAAVEAAGQTRKVE